MKQNKPNQKLVKTTFSRIIKYGFLCAFVLLTLVILIESLMPGDVSSEHSSAFGDIVDVSVDITVEPKSLSLKAADGELSRSVCVGDTITLSPAFTPANCTYKQVSWQASDPTVAQISGNVVTFIAAGVATVTATSEYDSSISASFEFEAHEVAVSGITIKNVSSLTVGSSVTVEATVSPSNATNKLYTIEIESDYATLSGHTITAISAGTVTVTAISAENPSITDVITLTITDPEPQHIDFIYGGSVISELNLAVMQSADISLKASPKNLSPQNLSWQVDGKISITFNSFSAFSITAYGEGQASVTATDRTVSATLIININAGDPPPTDVVIGLNGIDMTLELGQGRSVEFTPITQTGLEPTLQKYDYEVTDGADVVSVNELGLVTAQKIGNATVKVSLQGTDIFTLVNITVPELLIRSLAIDAPLSILAVGKEYTLTCTYKPTNATVKDIVWNCSDSGVATVTQNGVITFMQNGTVTVTVTAYGGATHSIELTSRNVLCVKEINLSHFINFGGFDDGHGTALLKLNDCAQIDIVFDESATYKLFDVSSSNAEILSVKDNTVTAINTGTATVTITYWDGDDNTTPIVYTVDVTVEKQLMSDVTSNWNTIIRKGIGHFLAFFALGICAVITYMLFIRRKWLAAILAVLSGFAIAAISEFFQKLVPNRGPALSDVLLDFKGFCCAAIPVIIVFTIVFTVKYFKAKKQSAPPSRDITK